MSAEHWLFFFFGGVAVLGALNLILQRHPIHSALSLILVMASLALVRQSKSIAEEQQGQRARQHAGNTPPKKKNSQCSALI